MKSASTDNDTIVDDDRVTDHKHFATDVIAGSMLGALCALLIKDLYINRNMIFSDDLLVNYFF